MKLSLFRISPLLIYYYPNMQPDMIDSMVDHGYRGIVIAGEITEREPYNGYLIFQGGIPEVEEFIRKFHK